MKNIFLIIISFGVGMMLCMLTLLFIPNFIFTNVLKTLQGQPTGPKQVVGFLPYWLLTKASQDYSQYITTLTYFALRIDKDGTLIKLASPTQEEPGWYALESGKVTPFLTQAKKHHLVESLAIDSGDATTINAFISTPIRSAKNLVTQVQPLMSTYGFSDLNLDIEYTADAPREARTNFTSFIKAVRNQLPHNVTLTLEISPIDAIQHHLIDIKSIAPFATSIILMAYDYHATDSLVTGPIAPLSGAGIMSEFDVTSAVDKALQFIPAQKIILGAPLYGYEWETIGTVPRSAIIPGSGVLASSRRVANLLAMCATCSAQLDADAQESYFSYFSEDTHTNHIMFFPDKGSTLSKIGLANTKLLGGIALWALGYEDNTILTPLKDYKKD